MFSTLDVRRVQELEELMKIVLDTNIFISGIFWEGNFSSQIIDLWRRGKLDLISSLPIIEELVRTLRNFKIQMSEEIVKSWKNMIVENAVIVKPNIKLDVVKEDPDDNKFIEAAVTGKAKYIVSQDKHLLKIKEYGGIKIIAPKEMLEFLKR